MKLYRAMLLSGLALAVIGAKKPQPDLERIVDAASGHMVTVTINGRPMKVRVEPTAFDRVMLNPASSVRAGLDGSMLKGSFGYFSVRVKMNSSLTRVRIGSINEGRRVFWTDRLIINEPADGIVSPVFLPENRVTMTFHPPARGERVIELPVEHSWRGGLRYKARVGEETVWVNFAPHRPLSVATAAAGAHLADMREGRWNGEPELVRIELGIDRPGRPMALRKPFDIGGLTSDSFMVRTADYRGRFQLPPDEEPDPDEIVVRGKTKSGDARLMLTLGQDVLGDCSSITHDKKRKMLTLRCL